MIIIGYQGIGKSTLAGRDKFIDLESGNFWVDGKRAEDWYKPYCQIAEHLSAQGFTVFTSSHEVVRKQLRNSKEKVFVAFPSLELKDCWIEKLKMRWEDTQLDKDYKAYMNALPGSAQRERMLWSASITCAAVIMGSAVRFGVAP